jgi:hypothetical protein
MPQGPFVKEALVRHGAQETPSGCSPWSIASSSRVRFDLALTIDPLYDFSPENGW